MKPTCLGRDLPTRTSRYSMKRYYPNLMHQPLAKEGRKTVKLNLAKVFNKCWLKKRFHIAKKDLPYRDKIRSEYNNVERKPSVAPIYRVDAWSRFCGYIRTTLRTPPKGERAIDLSPKRADVDYSTYTGEPSHQPLTPRKTPDKTKTAKQQTVKNSCSTKIERFDALRIIEMSAGRYLNFGLAQAIRHNSRGWTAGELQLTVGVYVHKTPNDVGLEVPRYLMILGRLATSIPQRLRSTGSFLIGVYEGVFSNVAICNEILQPFVTEMLGILNHGLDVMCPPQITGDYATPEFAGTVVLRAFVVDPIAGSLITCTALPSSLHGCPKCLASGEHQFNNDIVSFPFTLDENVRRDNSDYEHRTDAKFHLADPLIRKLPIGLVTQVVLDYKYTVCISVMQRLWTLWTEGQLDYRINRASLKRIDEQLIALGERLPVEFRSPPKTVEHMDSWSPYDWRQFLVYFGPAVLESVLPTKYYMHFVCLHLAVRIMVNRNVFLADNNSTTVAGFLLKRFVSEFAVFYGEDQVDHSVHTLLHYPDVMVKFGSIDDVGGFGFDDNVEDLRSQFFDWDVGGALNGLESLQEAHLNNNNPEASSLMNDGELFLDTDNRLRYNGFAIGTEEPDNFVITERGVLCVSRIQQGTNGDIRLFGECYKDSVALYQAPKTYQKCLLLPEAYDLEAIPLSEVISKGVGFQMDRGMSVMPMGCV